MLQMTGSGGRAGVASFALSVAWAFYCAACGNDGHAPVTAADAGSAGGTSGAAGTAGFAGSFGAAGTPPFICPTSDDGAEVLRDGINGIFDPLLDGAALYFPFHGGGAETGAYVIRISRLRLELNAATEELHTDQGYVVGFALGENHVWWAKRPTSELSPVDDRSTWMLHRVGKAGGAREAMVTGYVEDIVQSPLGLVLARRNALTDEFVGRFQLLPWSGGAPTDICGYDAYDHFAANDTTLVSIRFRAIDTCPLVGGDSTTLDLDVTGTANAFVVDSTHAYWRTLDAIHRIPLAGGARETVTAVTDFGPGSRSMVLDGEEIFYATRSQIYRVSKAGGEPREVAPRQTGLISFFVVGKTHVYWGEGERNGCVKRKLK
jgi:hypothetical protein